MKKFPRNFRCRRCAQGGLFALCAFLLLLSINQAEGSLDLDGDGVSELWALLHPDGASINEDSDGDGFSDFEEMVAGTNPQEVLDLFRLEQAEAIEGGLQLQWDGIAGKAYRIESYDLTESSWNTVATIEPKVFSGPMSHLLPMLADTGIYRLVVFDVDRDQDGLNAWEESLLGWSDDDALSASEDGVGDYESAVIAIEQVGGLELSNGQVLPQRLPQAAEASRFLVQSTFGPTLESIVMVMERGMSGWLQDQAEAPIELTRPNMSRSGISPSATWWRHGWWTTVITANDQLRQRIAYALSQILVVNNEPGTVIGDNPFTKANYYDQFLQSAFTPYREILEKVTYSPVMGFYLSHLNNRKSDATIGRFPDENFAREIMQLFTIGLWELEVNGQRKTTESGEFIPTYDNEVIRNMAKIFTGMSHTRSRGEIAESFFDTSNGNDYLFPMKVWDEEHEEGEKILFRNVVIPSGLAGDEDVQMTLDALAAHPNTGPFISRLLIQRFTSSNPSQQYISRVSAVWNTSGGNLERVIRGILLDPEARGRADQEFSGKVREPLLRLIHLLRAFGSPETSNSTGVQFSALNRDFGQFVMSSPSVFNFYLPDHSPSGELNDNGLFSPELEIATTSALLDTFNRFSVSVSGHAGLVMNYDDERLLASDPDALLDHLDILLTFGNMSPELKATIRTEISRFSNPTLRVLDSVRFIVNSPNYCILK